jgi:hypothetical protein
MFAFGAVLYEMLTGRKAFEGKSQASVIAAILERQPVPITSLRPLAPPLLDQSSRSVSPRIPEARWHSAGGNRAHLLWALAALLVGVAAGAAMPFLRRSSPDVEPTRLTITISREAILSESSYMGVPVVSPDGRRVAFVASGPNGPALWIRALDRLAPQLLPDTNLVSEVPFWSPDGCRLGFFAAGKLKVVSVDGGPAQVVCDSPQGLNRGGTWNHDGFILFGGASGLFLVPASGGTPRALRTPDASQGETALRFPYFLPDGRHFLY